jgi:hypothetical protein
LERWAHQGSEVRLRGGDRRYSAEPRFSKLSASGMVEAVVQKAGTATTTRRLRRPHGRAPGRGGARPLGIENSLHWVLDVIFKEDQSRLRAGHGTRNMAIVRHFAINAVRIGKGKRSIQTTRKLAGWNPDELARILAPHGAKLDSVPWRAQNER